MRERLIHLRLNVARLNFSRGNRGKAKHKLSPLPVRARELDITSLGTRERTRNVQSEAVSRYVFALPFTVEALENAVMTALGDRGTAIGYANAGASPFDSTGYSDAAACWGVFCGV